MKIPFEDIVKKYTTLLYAFGWRWYYQKPDEIDDLVQEIFYKAYKNYKNTTFENEHKLKSWLLTICRNTVLNKKRMKQEISLNEEELGQFEPSNIDAWLEEDIKKEEILHIKKKITELPEIEKTIVYLHIQEDFNFKEIAELLALSLGAVKMKYYRSIEKIRKQLI